jgi:hypothetical protein
MKTLLTLVVGLALLFLLAVVLAGTVGGETVVLRTADVDGSTQETRLWIQDLEGSEWLRTATPKNQWYQRLVARPVVDVKRQGQWRRYRAVPTPHRSDEISSAMARKYGWADWVIGLARDMEGAVAIRLVPASG